MTPQKPPDDKPSLTLVGRPFTAEKLAALFKRLTGKDATPDEMAGLRETCAQLNAKIADKNPE